MLLIDEEYEFRKNRKPAREALADNAEYIRMCLECEKESCDNCIGKKQANGTIKVKKQVDIPVHQYTLSGEYVCSYRSYKEAAEAVGVSARSISRAARGCYRTSGGYIWRLEIRTGLQ